MTAVRFVMVARLVLGLLSVSTVSEAQQARHVYRNGLLDYGSPDSVRLEWWNAFREQLRELDYVEGRHVTFEPRWARGSRDRLQKLAAELVALKVDVIVTATGLASRVVRQATATIPIVTATGPDPVGARLAVSLARPGGNVTGLTSISAELTGKRQELVRAIAPRVSRVAILWPESATLTTSNLFGYDDKPAGRRMPG